MGALRRAVSALARQQSRAFASNVNQTYGLPTETFKRKVRETARGRSRGRTSGGGSSPSPPSPREASSSRRAAPTSRGGDRGDEGREAHRANPKSVFRTITRLRADSSVCFSRARTTAVDRDLSRRRLEAFRAREHRTSLTHGSFVFRLSFPVRVLHSQVVIYSPARAACQQGKALLGNWKIHPGEQQKWENPLMGWTSTGDALSHQFNSVVNFESKEAAVAFCEKYGWEYDISEPQKMNPKGASTIPGAGKIGTKPKSYGDNFAVARKGIPVWPHPGFEAEGGGK